MCHLGRRSHARSQGQELWVKARTLEAMSEVGLNKPFQARRTGLPAGSPRVQDSQQVVSITALVQGLGRLK